MIYMSKFFKTKEEAKQFQKQNGCGALYSNVKGSRTKQSYLVEAGMRGMSMEFCEEHPFVVAWNESEEFQ